MEPDLYLYFSVMNSQRAEYEELTGPSGASRVGGEGEDG